MVVAVVFTIVDPYVIPIYFTVLPFHFILLYLALKTKNILFIFYCSMLFLSHGIGSIPFFLDRHNAQSIGFSAIGNFNFSYISFYRAYSYLLVFLFTLLFFVWIFKIKGHGNFLLLFIKQHYYALHLKSTLNLFPIISCTLLFVCISIFMYNLHIGMIGLQQIQLPFHLTGILFYSRRFLFPLVLIWIYVKTKRKDVATILLIVYSLIVGITATSKSASLLVLLPLTIINILARNKKVTFLCIVMSIFAYYIVGAMRLIIYEFDAEVDILSVISTPVEFSNNNIILSLMNSITGRLFGFQSTVLSDQYTQLSFSDLISFYTGSSITEIIPDYVYSLFGMTLPEDKAFGVGLGFTGTMQLLSCHNYLYTIIQAIIISCIFIVQNDCLQKILVSRKNVIFKCISILIIIFSFMNLFDGNEIFIVYVLTFILIFIRYSRFTNKKIRIIFN